MQGLDDPPAQRGRVLVGQRPLGRLEGDVDRDRLAALADLAAAIDVEDARLAQLRAGRLARRLDERPRGNVLRHREREVLLQARFVNAPVRVAALRMNRSKDLGILDFGCLRQDGNDVLSARTSQPPVGQRIVVIAYTLQISAYEPARDLGLTLDERAPVEYDRQLVIWVDFVVAHYTDSGPALDRSGGGRFGRQGRIHGLAKGGTTLNFGAFGLKALEPERITARQIEAARRAITRHLKRVGRVWIRIFPDVPVSKKPAEVRMGSGKGTPEFWVVRVKPGRIMFEIDGVPEAVARESLRLGAAKLSVRTKIVSRMEGL